MSSATPGSAARGHLTTTTVRFDPDLWADVRAHSRRLGVKQAAFVRDAVRVQIARVDERDQVARGLFGADLDALAARVGRIEHLVRRR